MKTGNLRPFEFATAGRIVFGPGSLAGAIPAIASFGSRILVVCGSNPARSQGLVDALESQGISICRFGVDTEPTLDTVRQGLLAAHEISAQAVVAIGGGSVLDAGKAIAALLGNPGDPLDYLEIIGRGQPLLSPSAPFVAIPTTAGTGSEATRNAVLGSPEHGVKASMRSPGMLPALAIVDPTLTLSLPLAPTVYTGLDALTQLIEPFVCRRANPFTDALCRQGIALAAPAIRKVTSHPDDIESRSAMALASTFGGIALANAGLGAVHGFAAPIGGRFSAPHGAICAALLPHVMAANVRALRQREAGNPALARYEEVARVLTGDAQATAEVGAEWCASICKELAIPPLRHWGLQAEDADSLSTQAAKANSMKANPVDLTHAELCHILQAAC